MKRYLILFLLVLVPVFSALSMACERKFCPLHPPLETVTPTPSVEISTCGSTPAHEFLDTYGGSSSLSNYSFYLYQSDTPTTPASQNFTVTGGEIQESSSTTTSFISAYALVNNAQFSTGLSNYTVESDMKLDTHSGGYGLFGVAFLMQSTGEGYVFQWNANPENGTPHWQVEKWTGVGGSSYTYLTGSGFGTGVAAPAYALGTWAHLKVVVSGGGTTFNCYVNLYDGNGDQLVFNNLTDTTGAPLFTSGAVGIRTTDLVNPNLFHARDFHAFTCP